MSSSSRRPNTPGLGFMAYMRSKKEKERKGKERKGKGKDKQKTLHITTAVRFVEMIALVIYEFYPKSK